MSLKTQVENMSRSCLFSPLQDVYENKGSYTLLSKMFMKRKVVRGIWSFCRRVIRPSAHRVIWSSLHLGPSPEPRAPESRFPSPVPFNIVSRRRPDRHRRSQRECEAGVHRSNSPAPSRSVPRAPGGLASLWPRARRRDPFQR